MAAGGEDAVSPCAVSCDGNHVLFEKSRTSTYDRNANGHALVTTYVFACRYCTYSEISTVEGSRVAHTSTIYDATCNGTMQTWHYGCSICGYHIRTDYTHRCPGAVHTGDCLWLPA